MFLSCKREKLNNNNNKNCNYTVMWASFWGW